MSWINFPGFRGGPAAVTHGHSSSSSGSGGHHDPATMPMAPNESETTTTAELDIRKNMIQCAELKKLNTRFYSEVLRKKFFVLYEDSRRSVTNPRDHNTESDEEDEGFEPARLEYYNSQRNWEAGDRPRRVIVLRDAFTITRKRDTKESIHKYVIAIYTVEACLGIVFDTEEVMKTWLEMLISCQMGGRDIEGRIPKPKYEHVFEVDIQQFEPDTSSNTFQMSGSHRMVVAANDVKFFAVGSNKPMSILISSIRGCSISRASRKVFKLEIGKSSESGSGVLVMKCKDEEISDTIRATMYAGMQALSERNANSSTRHRHNRTSLTFNSNNMRTRTHSWSNMDKKSGPNFVTAKPIINHHHKNPIGIDRHRTTSEGNSHFDLKHRGSKKISGSPMSPGSFVSSESAGSSNSLDETDDNRIVTPIDDHMGPATIFEESSAESCVENLNSVNTSSSVVSCLKNPTPSESRILANEQDINVNYTPIDILPSSSSFSNTGTNNSGALMASSPPGTSVHYSTILMDSAKKDTKESDSYMIMSPPPPPQDQKSNEEKSNLLRQHKPLMDLLANHEFEDNSASSVTSPNSQSSYNPLMDEVQTDDSSAYVVMSPATSASSGSRMGTAPRKISHQRSGSNSMSKTPSDYVDMSPASRSGVPIPNRNERTSSLSFGTSPSAALTSHLISYGDSKKTPSEESPYLVMSPVDPDKEFSTSKIPVKLRTASIDSTGTTSSSGTRPKTNRRFTRGQSDSQRSSLCFDDHWNDLGISPQDSSGGTLMGPDCTDYAPLHSADLTRSTTISKAELDSLQPVAAVSRLRLDNNSDEPLELDDHHPTRAYSVGCRPNLLTGSSSSVSTTGSSGHSHHHSRQKSRFIDIPGATTASGTSGTGTGSHSSSISPGNALISGQSPSSMAARLGSWIRHRTGSVPSKSAITGRRRHRTQSEGEKDDI